MTQIAEERARVIACMTGAVYTSGWLTVSQQMVDRFADATGDHQYIHVDPQRAAQTPFGGTIAHGFLLLSLLPRLLADAGRPAIPGVVMGINYGTDRVRFVQPVRTGSEVRGQFTIADIQEKAPGRYQQVLDAEVQVQGQEKPALIARWIGQFVVDTAA